MSVELPQVKWEGAVRMHCSTLRELTLYGDEPMPTHVYCYYCRRVEDIARYAEYLPRQTATDVPSTSPDSASSTGAKGDSRG